MTRSSRIDRRFHSLSAGLALVLAASVAMPASDALATVGVAAAVNQSAEGVRPGGAPQVITIGKDVIANERIDTSDVGLVQVLLRDGTTFTVGPGTSLVIDRFVYDPDRGTAEVAATITKGAFRMIGGLATKRRGGATINTPSGSIGIRGAMLEGVVGSAQGTQFSLVFGDEARFTGTNGKTTRLYEPGYTLVVEDGGSPKVRRRTAGDAQAFRVALAGTTGKTGGARRSPTNAVVAQSPISEVNSGASLRVTTPVFRPVAVQSSEIETIAEEVAEIAIEERIEPRVLGLQEEPVVVLDVPTPVFRSLRVRTNPGTYLLRSGSFSADLGNAGSRGLVGSTEASDFIIDAASREGRLVGSVGGRAIDLPDVTGTQGDVQLDTIILTDATIDGVAASGVAYAGRGDFAVYTLFENGNLTNPVYAITGTPTDESVLLATDTGTDIRAYSLTSDPVRPSPAAFFATDFYGQPSNFNATPFYLVEPNQSSSAETETYYSFIDISGTGRNQRSAAVVHASNVFTNPNSGRAIFDGSRRGGMRVDATLGSFNLRGGLGTISGANEASFFGANAEHFVVGSANHAGHTDTFFDSPVNGSQFGITFDTAGTYVDDPDFGTFHVASLTSETPQSQFSRTSRQVSGFANGLIEPAGTTLQSAYFGTSEIGSTSAPNFTMSISAAFNGLGGLFTVTDTAEGRAGVQSIVVPFGASQTTRGGNTFVTDDIFAAVQPNDRSQTKIVNDSGTVLAHDPNNSPGTYLVSGRANPIPGYQHCTTCTFMDWGWWGTRVQANNPDIGSGGT